MCRQDQGYMYWATVWIKLGFGNIESFLKSIDDRTKKIIVNCRIVGIKEYEACVDHEQ